MMIPRPEGFVVNELPGDYGKGECTHFTLTKREWNTLDALSAIAKALGVRKERFGFAGLKDRNAITSQRISAWRIPAERLKKISLPGIKLSDFKEGLEKIRVGSHNGNKFKITILGASLKDIKEPKNVPNLFGPQRFGGNEEMGEKIVKGSLPLRELKKFDKRLIVLWINAWQAREWNKHIDLSLKTQPLPSCTVEGLGKFEGGERETVMNVMDFKAKRIKGGVRLSFALPKGSYATTLIKFLTGRQVL